MKTAVEIILFAAFALGPLTVLCLSAWLRREVKKRNRTGNFKDSSVSDASRAGSGDSLASGETHQRAAHSPGTMDPAHCGP